ncbi:MAG: CARDB domain-containing protein [Candidatus Heimdallarchaeaceae archaeon]
MSSTKTKVGIMIFLIITSTINLNFYFSIEYSLAGSPSSGDIPPPGGQGSDTSGGSASGGLYLNYRIPLIFRTGKFAPTLVSITTLQNGTLIIFGFEPIAYENITVLNIGETLILDPRIEINMENGSLIQSFSPLQITVFHESNTNTSDDTFSYSVLVMSMWGRNYQSPFENMRAMIVAGFNQTELDVTLPSGEVQYLDLPLVGQTLDIEVPKGTIIQSNGPIGVVFYSLSESNGSFTFTGIPEYLWGREYYLYPLPDISSNPLLTGENEITLSVIGEGENVIATTNFDQTYLIEIPSNKTVKLSNSVLSPDESYYQISSSFINFSLSILYDYSYNGVRHLSAIQYISAPKMKWAEWFYTNKIYSNTGTQSIILNDNTVIVPIVMFQNQLYFDLGNYTTKNKGNFFSYFYNDSSGLIAINGSLFSYSTTSLPENEVWNSSTNLLFPLNLFSYSANTSTYFPSWYRFPNINVKKVIVNPEKPTEFRRLELDIVVQNNGTIPSAPFWVTVYVNDTLKIHKKIEGLDINQTETLVYEEFQGFGLKVLNISIFTDSLNQIFELQEFDNNLEFFVIISRNYNIIYVSVAIAVIVIGAIAYLLIKKIIQQRKTKRTRFDVILSDIEV